MTTVLEHLEAPAAELADHPGGSGGAVTGPATEETFPADTDVTLTAAHDGAGQISWDGCDMVDGDTCQVRVTADTRVGADVSGSN
jgi:hypothetical protein